MALSDVRVEWKGLEVLTKLPDQFNHYAPNAVARAYKYALKPVKDRMKSNIKIRTSRLYYSIDTTVSKAAPGFIAGMYAVTGPRRKRGRWNQQGFHAHLVERGAKPHKITAGPGKLMPVFNKGGFTGKFAKTIDHPGYEGKKPFKRSIDSEWYKLGSRVNEKLGEIVNQKIRAARRKYGNKIS